jgi:hypothetical protein
MRNAYKINLKGRDNLGKLIINGRLTLQWSVEKQCDFRDLIYLALNSVQWRALVNTVIHFRFHKRRRNSWPAEWLSASHAELCSTEFVKISYNGVEHRESFTLSLRIM